ncbi:MAG: zinc-dependent peptidase [bacterium]|nr:zinc-dependent peptidase [bacterium]
MGGVGVLVLGVVLARRQRRRRALAAPFPPAWRALLRRAVYLYQHLPDTLTEQLHNDIKLFLAEKTFEGCGGLTVTEEMKVIIAAEACLLLLNRPVRMFPHARSILVYPHPYVAEAVVPLGTQYTTQPSVRAGESWQGGDVVLAWDYVAREAASPADGQNVVLHEFAHQLDQEDGHANGAPRLASRSRYAAWAQAFSAEYEQLLQDIAQQRPHVLDEYGATNPAEFFAVATEAFFERPDALHQRDPRLYEQLQQYYQLDPVAWRAAPMA